MMTRGDSASARAMQMRWRWPPENSWGCRRICSGIRPDAAEELGDAVAPLGAAGDAVDRQRLADEVADGHARVERRRRGPGRPSGCRAGSGASPPGSRPRVGRPAMATSPLPGNQVHQGAAGGRLAAARLADERQGLARADVEADALDRVQPRDRAAEHAAPHVEARPSGRGPRRPGRRRAGSGAAAGGAEAGHGGEEFGGVGARAGRRRGRGPAPPRPCGRRASPRRGRPSRRPRPCRG